MKTKGITNATSRVAEMQGVCDGERNTRDFRVLNMGSNAPFWGTAETHDLGVQCTGLLNVLLN